MMNGDLYDLVPSDGATFGIVARDEVYMAAIMWPLTIVVIVGLLLLVVLLLGPRLFGVRRLASAAIRCPLHDRAVAVEFVESVWDGRRVDVSRCSIFEPSTDVKCDKRCVDGDELTERGWPGSVDAPRHAVVGGTRAMHRGDEW